MVASSPITLVATDDTACGLEVGLAGGAERWRIGCGSAPSLVTDSTCTRIGAYTVAVWYANDQLCSYSGSGEVLLHEDGALARRDAHEPPFGTLLHSFPCLSAGVTLDGSFSSGDAVYRVRQLGDVPVVLAEFSLDSEAQMSEDDRLMSISQPARLLVSANSATSVTVGTSRDSIAVRLSASDCGGERKPSVDSINVRSAWTLVDQSSGESAVMLYIGASDTHVTTLFLSSNHMYRVVCESAVCEIRNTIPVRGPLVTGYECGDMLCELYATPNNSLGVIRHALE